MKNPYSRALSTARYRLMIVSAKGGVGKSTMTVNIAAALAARGLKVGIFDADVHGPNIPALFGITQRKSLRGGMNPDTMVPIEAGPDSMDFRPIQPVERYGIKLMSLGLLVGEQQALTPEPDTLGPMVSFLLARVDWGGADVLLLDMPPGTGEPLNTLIAAGLISGTVIVAVRERLAHLDNGRLLNILRKAKVPLLGVVENMTHVVCPRCGELIELYPSPAAEEAVYGDTPILATVPFHPHLIRQVRSGPPVPLAEPQSPVAGVLLALADQIIPHLNNNHRG